MATVLNLEIERKARNSRELLVDSQLTIQDGEKVALIGRNGAGKSTLFGLIDGSDDDYRGTVRLRKGATLIATRQEHNGLGDVSCLDYILSDLPHYAQLHHIIETYPATMGEDMAKIEEYSHALERFGELDYYTVEERVIRNLEAYQLPEAKVRGKLSDLSGGQKRFVELVKVTQSQADLALLDEPTNHMDAAGKAAFIEWLKQTPLAVMVISHDRDVLQVVDRIIELKDKQLDIFKGNYDAYLKQNSSSTTSDVAQYEVAQRTMENLQKQLQQVRAKKAGSSKTPNPFIPMERRLMKQYDALKAGTQKPNFWIDKESVSELKPDQQERYDRYKARGLRLRAKGGDGQKRQLVDITGLQLGYPNKDGLKPLFQEVNLKISSGERWQLNGRNGAGKTTLIKALLAKTGRDVDNLADKVKGTIAIDTRLVVGMYDQEVDAKTMELPLGKAITDVYHHLDKPINDQKVRQLLGDYLFDPNGDYERQIKNMSGGQKARFQLIRMFAAEPNLLILDEPTNHLDLPSIEELETAIGQYQGAVLYVSHDSYFRDNIGGDTVEVSAA